MSKNDPDHEDYVRPIYRTSYGEIGVVLVAAVCTLAFALMMILPSPFAKYEKAKKAQEAKERQEALSKPVPGGEVTVGIVPPKR